MERFRFVHVGVAAALAAGAVIGVGVIGSVGAAGTASASSFVPIVPCRLVDTRSAPDTIGERATALLAGESATFAVHGVNGNCDIPFTAVGISQRLHFFFSDGQSIELDALRSLGQYDRMNDPFYAALGLQRVAAA